MVRERTVYYTSAIGHYTDKEKEKGLEKKGCGIGAVIKQTKTEKQVAGGGWGGWHSHTHKYPFSTSVKSSFRIFTVKKLFSSACSVEKTF